MTRFKRSARLRRRQREQAEDWRPTTFSGWLGLIGGYILFLPFIAITFLAGFTLFGGWRVLEAAPTWLRWTAYCSAGLIGLLIVVGTVGDWYRQRSLPEERWIKRRR